MLVQEEAYFNFVNSINSDVTRKNYEYCMSKFLRYCNLDLQPYNKLTQARFKTQITYKGRRDRRAIGFDSPIS